MPDPIPPLGIYSRKENLLHTKTGSFSYNNEKLEIT